MQDALYFKQKNSEDDDIPKHNHSAAFRLKKTTCLITQVGKQGLATAKSFMQLLRRPSKVKYLAPLYKNRSKTPNSAIHRDFDTGSLSRDRAILSVGCLRLQRCFQRVRVEIPPFRVRKGLNRTLLFSVNHAFYTITREEGGR